MDVPEPSGGTLEGPLSDWALAHPSSSNQPPAVLDPSLVGLHGDHLEYAEAMDLDEEAAAELRAALLLSMGDAVPASAAEPPWDAASVGTHRRDPHHGEGMEGPGGLRPEGTSEGGALPDPMECVDLGDRSPALPQDRTDGTQSGAGAALPEVDSVGTMGTEAADGLPLRPAAQQRQERDDDPTVLADQGAELPTTTALSEHRNADRFLSLGEVQTTGGPAGRAPASGGVVREPGSPVPAVDTAADIPAGEGHGDAPLGCGATISRAAAVGEADEIAPLASAGPGDLLAPQTAEVGLDGRARDGIVAPAAGPGSALGPESRSRTSVEPGAAAGHEPLVDGDGTAGDLQLDLAGQGHGDAQHVPHVDGGARQGDASLGEAPLSAKMERRSGGFVLAGGGLAMDAEPPAIPSGPSDDSVPPGPSDDAVPPGAPADVVPLEPPDNAVPTGLADEGLQDGGEGTAAPSQPNPDDCEMVVHRIVRNILDRLVDEEGRGLQAVSAGPSCTALPSASPLQQQPPPAGEVARFLLARFPPFFACFCRTEGESPLSFTSNPDGGTWSITVAFIGFFGALRLWRIHTDPGWGHSFLMAWSFFRLNSQSKCVRFCRM